jgi:hypothetical protein
MKKILLFFIVLVSAILNDSSYCAEKVILNGENLFPLVKWGEINIKETLNGESKVLRIPLGFCTASIVQNDNTKISGRTLDGKKWEVVLDSPGAYIGGNINVFLGDLDQNGLTDIILQYSEGPTNGPTAIGSTRLLFILFDKNGWPHPEEFFVNIREDAPFKNILQDSQGRAVLVYKRLVPSGESNEDYHSLFCYAAFYRAVNAKWEKISAADLRILNQNSYSSFNMNPNNKKFINSDQSWENCSGNEEENAPDFSEFQVLPFKILRSFKMDVNEPRPRFQLIAEDEKGRNQEINIAEFESCYVVIEKADKVKILNFMCDEITKEMAEMEKEKLPVRFIRVKNASCYFIYFVKGNGRTF